MARGGHRGEPRALSAAFDARRSGATDAGLVDARLHPLAAVPVARGVAGRLRGFAAALAAPGPIDQMQRSKELVEAAHSNLNDPAPRVGHTVATEKGRQ
jgi:hypothetical protein